MIKKIIIVFNILIVFIHSEELVPSDEIFQKGNFNIIFNSAETFNLSKRFLNFTITKKNNKKVYVEGTLNFIQNGFSIKTSSYNEEIFLFSEILECTYGKTKIFINNNYNSFSVLNNEKIIFQNRFSKDEFLLKDIKLIKHDMGLVYDNIFFIDMIDLKTRDKIICEKKSGVRVILLNIKSDIYGISSSFNDIFIKDCYQVIDFYKVYDYIYQEKIDIDNIDEFILKKIGDHFNADKIYYGHSYIVNVPLKYTSTTSDDIDVGFLNNSNNQWIEILDTILDLETVGRQAKERNSAIKEAGSYVYLTYFSIDVKSGQKEYIYLNNPTIKLD